MSDLKHTEALALLRFIDRHKLCDAKIIDVGYMAERPGTGVRLVCSSGEATEAWLAHGDTRQPVTLIARRHAERVR
jgi:hypothetical protein